MKRAAVVFALGLFACLLRITFAHAQATAQVSGTVRDPSGAVLPGVEVTATQTETGIVRTTVSNETGSFVLPNLALGPYKLEAALPGFRTFVQTGIVLQVNSNPVINPILEVGQVSEQIEVQANAALVETRNTTVGQVIENARILELPLNGRQAVELISLTGASTPSTALRGIGVNWNSVSFSIAGGLSYSVAYSLDGATHNNPANNLELPMPFPDALQEFKVETSGFAAQSGMHASGSVSGVTKSGTNQLHGDLFEFVRNYKFNARNFFATKRDTLKRNQFGGTLGGPIRSNRVFFFGGYQGTIIRQDASDTTGFVPSAAMLAGDFTAVTSPACNVGRPQINLRAPFVNNQIDPALFNKGVLNVVNYSSFPKTTDPCGRIVYGGRNISDSHQAVGRIDYQRTASNSFFGRYMATSLDNPAPYTFTPNLLLAGTLGFNDLAQSFTLGDTYLVGSKGVVALRAVANRSASTRTNPNSFAPSDLGVKSHSYVKGCANIVVTGGPTISCGIGPGKLNEGQWGGNGDVSWVAGNHQIAFGVSAAHTDYNYSAAFFAAGGRYTFNGQITGLGMADFLTGTAFNFIEAPPDTHRATQNYFGTYIQDTWKMTPKLTWSGGVRWEPFLPQQRVDNGVQAFDLNKFQQGVRTTQFKFAPAGLFFPGDPGFPERSGMYRQWANFSPRLGVAWDPSGNGRTSIRAAYSYSYDFPGIQYHINTSIAPPRIPKITVRSVPFDDPWRDYPGGSPFPFVVDANAPFPPFAVFTTMRYDTKNPAISQWNVSLQRQLSSDLLISASYIGSNSTHLWTQKNLNTAVYIAGATCTINGVPYTPCSSTANTDQRRKLFLQDPQSGSLIGNLNLIDDGGTASYHGLLLTLQKRAARGLTLNANYTWSHCISDPYENNPSGANGDGAYKNPDNRRADRGNCNTSAADRRQTFNLTAVAETPRFSGKTLRTLATGWRFAPLVRIQSGAALTVTTTTDVALNGLTNQRLNQALPSVYGNRSVSNYLNPAAFALPATGTFGNMGTGSVVGPVFWQFDTALSRVFQVRESQRIEFRAEAFNVTNSLRKGTPVTNFAASNFGQITTASDPRIMQFAFKYIF